MEKERTLAAEIAHAAMKRHEIATAREEFKMDASTAEANFKKKRCERCRMVNLDVDNKVRIDKKYKDNFHEKHVKEIKG